MYPLKQSTALTVPFFAHDANGNGVTALVDGGFTKRISKNGAAFGVMTVTVTEMENGWYSIPVDTGHSDTLGLLSISISNASCQRINLQFRVHVRLPDDHAFPATSGRSMVVDAAGLVDANTVKLGATGAGTAQTARDLGLALPAVAAGSAGGLPVIGSGANNFKSDASANVTFANVVIATVTTLTNLPAITSNWLTAAGINAAALNGKGDWNIGKTGYSLSAAGVQAIWDALTSALIAVGSIGKKLADWVLGSDNKMILSNNAHTGAVVPTVTAVTNDVGVTQVGADKAWGTAARVLTAGSNIVLAKGIGVTGFNDIAASAIIDDATPFHGASIAAILADTATLPPDPADASDIAAATASIQADTDNIQIRLPAALVGGRMDVNVGAIAAGAITAAAIATDAVDANALAANAVDKILDDVVEGTITLRQMLRGFASALLSKTSGSTTATLVFQDIGGTKPRITATVDVSGNRNAVTLDLT